MLDVVNLLLIILIIVVLVVNTIYLSSTRKSLSNISLVDLAELRDLNSNFKDSYHKYVVDEIMPKINEKINVELEKNKFDFDKKFAELAEAVRKSPLF